MIFYCKNNLKRRVILFSSSLLPSSFLQKLQILRQTDGNNQRGVPLSPSAITYLRAFQQKQSSSYRVYTESSKPTISPCPSVDPWIRPSINPSPFPVRERSGLPAAQIKTRSTPTHPIVRSQNPKIPKSTPNTTRFGLLAQRQGGGGPLKI